MRRLCSLVSLLVIVSALAGCMSGPMRDKVPPRAPVVNVAWNDVIGVAKLDPFYAGSFVSDRILWIGFTRDAPTKLAAITHQPNIRSYFARHSAVELEKAFKSTVEILDVSRFGATSAYIDFRQNAITVGSAYSLQDNGGPTPKCSALAALPRTAPGTDVELIDVRDCQK
jgi:hypothetical protein